MKGSWRSTFEEIVAEYSPSTLWDGIPKLSCIPLISGACLAMKLGAAVDSTQQNGGEEKSSGILALAG